MKIRQAKKIVKQGRLWSYSIAEQRMIPVLAYTVGTYQTAFVTYYRKLRDPLRGQLP